MPAKSSKQYKAMVMAKLGKSSLGIPANVGKDFVSATPKSKRSAFMSYGKK